MKTAVKIFALILAAALCAGLFSCASVPTPPPAVTDTDAAETVGVPDTTNFPETVAVTTAPETAAPDTKTAETTNVPVTTPAVTDSAETTGVPDTTGIPETDAVTTAPVTTQAPETTTAETSATESSVYKLIPASDEPFPVEQISLDENGLVKIAGSELIRLPASGRYLEYVEKDGEIPVRRFFVSETVQTTVRSFAVPTYMSTNGARSVKVNNGVAEIALTETETLTVPLTLNGEVQNVQENEITIDLLTSDIACFHTKNVLFIYTGGAFTAIPFSYSIADYLPLTKSSGLLRSSAISFSAGMRHLGVQEIDSAGNTLSSYNGQMSGRSRGKFAYDLFLGKALSAPLGTYTAEYLIREIMKMDTKIDTMITPIVDGIYFSQSVGVSNWLMSTLPPFFDGDAGVWPLVLSSNPGEIESDARSITEGDICYYLTMDGGNSWRLYDPGPLAVVTAPDSSVEYDCESYSRRG